ncbi:hypothetical protein Taro_046268 [Colocasia esculenta]|uniref:Uncharacterized protein n=1 Tax=Colocasia esculenta TaxID=4460 RepID=A0A843WPE4_COLES|nr:hypothetical protein [Colocasia esculenta]
MGPRGKRRSYRCSVQPLTPLMEGPDVEVHSEGGKKESSWDAIRSWVRTHMERGVSSPSGHLPVFLNGGSSSKRMDLRLTLGVLGCPLAPISLPIEPFLQRALSFKDDPLATTSAQYIIQQYLAATGCLKPRKCVKNVYTAGTLRMACCETETSSGKQVRNAAGARGGGESGCFVLWQMSPGMWSVELVVAGCKVVAGSNGKIVWRC